ncbi:MAG TPA: glycosyltransferase [Pirellulales bacterium]|nr:glycosyltransferase [Pirellulales bacterium]
MTASTYLPEQRAKPSLTKQVRAPAALRPGVDGKFFTREGERLRVQGVTYGPFAPNIDGEPFPARGLAAADFEQMTACGVNAIRTYHLPPEWLLALADELRLNVFVDVPWSKHLCFLEGSRARREARHAVHTAATRGRAFSSVLAYSIGNEIPPDVLRWHGSRRVARWLAELCDVAKQADPLGLVTYASYPPTEYLDLSFLDFATFNVYLHDRAAFRRYLFRLQNLVGDKPLLLGEIGMDTVRHGQAAQAEFLGGHVREATLLGLAGAFVFSWTDDWHTGGHTIHDWAFGITQADRTPKHACRELDRVFQRSPAELLQSAPRVSVVVCSYNGGATLEQCLRSLAKLDYPDYEVIVVDDGSTDDTPEILADFPNVRAIHQPNQGLSVARNVGLQAATGSIVAYTDSDCFADAHWLTHLVDQLLRSDAAAVGGPNLTPDDGHIAACVAASPGQPTHVLESDQVAEHIPGCNMAYRREALEAINGFDPQYRKAGDDVDVCWRLQDAGFWITYAPGAFVWHHRRQTPRAYLKQQAGYGEAEALLHFKHPDRFNGRGEGKWRGVLYGASLQGLRFGRPIIYRGTFGTALFQCLYQPGPAHWAMLPSTLEWHIVAAVVALWALLWPPLILAAIALLATSATVALLQASQARLVPRYAGIRSRTLIAALCYLQPLIRSWSRYHTRLFSRRAPQHDPSFNEGDVGQAFQPDVANHAYQAGKPDLQGRLPLAGRTSVAYWSESGTDRIALLNQAVAYMNEHRWGKVLDSGWFRWDVEVYCGSGLILKLITAQEEHGSGRRLVRVRYQLMPSGLHKLATLTLLTAAAATALTYPWLGAGLATLSAACIAVAWFRALRSASRVIRLFDLIAQRLGMARVQAPGGYPGLRVQTIEDSPASSF